AVGRLRTAPADELAAVMVLAGLWAGRVDLARDALQRFPEDSADADAATGAVLLFDGDIKGASKAFASAYQALGRDAWRDMALLYAPLAWTLDGGKARRKQAERLIGGVAPRSTDLHSAWCQLP